MKKKGRIQAGMDADLIVFDLTTLQDQATYDLPNRTSVGVRHVLVNGVFVVRDCELDVKAFPGKPVRRNVSLP
jgi:N-acyl-D-glutamate deacylase